jgi:cell division protease FtsH
MPPFKKDSNTDEQTPKQGGNQQGSNKPDSRQFWMNILVTFVIFLLLVTGYSYFVEFRDEPEEVPLSQVAQDIKAEQVESIDVQQEELTITYEDGSEKVSRKEAGTALTETLKNYDVTAEMLSSVSIDVQAPGGFQYWFMNLAPFLLPLLLIGFFLWFLSRQMRGAGMQAFSFGQSKARMIDPNDQAQRVTFKDVAGAKEAKEELTEIVDFLKHPKKFIEMGAQTPKGLILMGAPGTGKTMLARAVAGEAGVPFFSISGSEFVEMFVGVGASRTRDLFRMAKKAAPAIIFIDEIDAVGRIRGTGIGGGNDEREQTLNQILVELDGFEPHEKVIVMAATNRPDVLDPALLRPGRFDRRVVIDLPDRSDRLEILQVHARKKPTADDVDLETIAERTPGFSGADLYSLMNEAAILAARNSRKKIKQEDLVKSIEKVMLGPERRSHLLTEDEKRVTAYHEGGHALVASVLPHADPVHKITVVSRGRTAGYTLKLPFEDRRMQSQREFMDDIATSLGGYIAEKKVFGNLTTGASNDLQVLTALARDMVTKYGMSDEIGPVALESSGGQPAYGQGGDRDYSQELSTKIDREVNRIIDEAYKNAESIIEKHRDALDAIAEKLVEVETLERPEFEKMLKEHGIEPKQKDDKQKRLVA